MLKIDKFTYSKGLEWRKWDLHIHSPFLDTTSLILNCEGNSVYYINLNIRSMLMILV